MGGASEMHLIAMLTRCVPVFGVALRQSAAWRRCVLSVRDADVGIRSQTRPQDTASVFSPLPSSESLFAAPVVSSVNDLSQYPYHSLPIQFRLDELGTEMESEDDDCSESSSVSSDGASSFDSSSVCSLANELDSLNERRREMLQLSIAKIHSMNASNINVSLRKSLLIYNTMKSLQRDLEESGEDVFGSLIEGNEVSSDEDSMNEENVQRPQDEWECEHIDQNVFPSREQRESYSWAWSDDNLSLDSRTNVIQDLEMCGDILTNNNNNNNNNNNTSMRNNDSTTTGMNSLWSSNSNASPYIDDYLGMWGACENDDYNPLNNCNLTQSEILHMFGPPTHHILNNQLVSQA
uniref:SERTA domain-containing protein n=1 Tax=Ascaris lumbricoides TaxID=6252 RepID=A0A0M3IB69_ASCLU